PSNNCAQERTTPVAHNARPAASGERIDQGSGRTKLPVRCWKTCPTTSAANKIGTAVNTQPNPIQSRPMRPAKYALNKPRNCPPSSNIGKKPKIRGRCCSSSNQNTRRFTLIVPTAKMHHKANASQGDCSCAEIGT